MLDRNLDADRTRTPEERRAEIALEHSIELRQLADEAIAIDQSADRHLRDDLNLGPLTTTTAAAIADKVLDERLEMGLKLSHNAQLYAFKKRDAEKDPRFAMDEKYNGIDIEVPTIRQGQRLEFVRMADANDLARAEVDTPQHRAIMEDGVPLQSYSGYAVIGLPPGDLEHSQKDLAQARANGEPAYGVYKITNAYFFKEYEL